MTYRANNPKKEGAARSKPWAKEPLKQMTECGARSEPFVVAVRRGLDELDRGESIPLEEVERELPSSIDK